jgi:uncharacterized protein
MPALMGALLVSVMILFGFPQLSALSAVPVPPLSGPVVDRAGLLSADDQARLEALSRAARAEEAGQGVQLQFLIVSSLEGEPIEDFSIRVAEAWKVGSRGQDNGVLIVVARDDRQVRIEVGGGLEGGLTDAQSGRIIRQTIAPAFRAGHYGEGLYDAAVQVLGAVGALPTGVVQPSGSAAPQADGSGSLEFIVVSLLFVAVLLIVWRRLGGGAFFLPLFFGGPGSGSSGRGGWGSGGGGGWSGGGGGFSGGGASGGW